MIKKLLRSLALCTALVLPGSAQTLEQRAVENVPEFRADSFVNGAVYALLKGRLKYGIDNGARIIGQNGFSLFPADNSRVRFGEESIAYAYSDGKNLLPKKESLEKEISQYLSYSLCYNTGENVFYEDLFQNNRMPSPNVSLSKKSLNATSVFPSNYPIPGGVNIGYRFKVTQNIPLNLGEFYDIAREIVESEIKNPDKLPADVFKKYSKRFGFSMASSGNDVVYVITARGKYWDRTPEFSVMFANHFATPRNYKTDGVENLKALGDFSKLPRYELDTELKNILSRIRESK